MERDDIKYLLANYYRYKEQIQYLNEQIEKLEARATKRTQTFTPDPNTTPIDNPRPSKVEKNAIKIVELKETRDAKQKLLDAAEKLRGSLRPHQRYLIDCVISNKMPIAKFAKKENVTPSSVKQELALVLKRLEKVEI